jgi:hypothetical protein
MTSLWNQNSQLRRVFGWTDILASWDDSLVMPPYVQTVIDNLRAATDESIDYPLEHFTNFLNEEQDGLKWFLYEIISMRWMWGNTRIDYLRRLVDMFEDLDSFFPDFVGSPRQTQTVREFVESNLDDDERAYVNMMPQLQDAYSSYAYASASVPPVQRAVPPPPPAPVADTAKYPPIVLRFLRMNGRNDSSGKKDDILSIYKTTAGYNIVYNDQESSHKTYTRDLIALQVMRRIRNSLKLMSVDNDPFDSIQLLVPNMPSVLVYPEELDTGVCTLLCDAIEATMEEWPSTR